MEDKIIEVFSAFGIEGEIKGYKIFHSGHINTTCMVTIEQDGKENNWLCKK